MDSSVALDLASLVCNLTFIGLAVTAFSRAYTGRTSLRRLTTAVRLARIALPIAVVVVAVNVADIPHDGPVWPVLNTFTAVVWGFTAHYMRKRRDAEGDRVVAEAERTVRNYTPPTWER